MLWDSPTAADIAITSRLNSDNSIPSCPGDTITHRRNTARNLTNRIRFMQGFTNDFWIVFIRLVSGEHVVIGGDDGDIVTQHAFQRGFVFWLAGSETVCRYRMPTANDERSKFSLVLSGRGKQSESRANVQ